MKENTDEESDDINFEPGDDLVPEFMVHSVSPPGERNYTVVQVMLNTGKLQVKSNRHYRFVSLTIDQAQHLVKELRSSIDYIREQNKPLTLFEGDQGEEKNR